MQLNPAPAGEQVEQAIDHADAATDIRGHRRAGHPEFGERPVAVDQAGVEDDVDAVRQSQRAHGDGRIASTPEDRVDEKQEHDAETGAEHDAGVALAGGDHGIVCTHDAQDVLGIEDTNQAHHHRHEHTDPDHLPRRNRRGLGILLTDTPCHHGGRPHGEADGDGVQQRDHRLGQAHRRDRIGTETGHEEDIHDGEHRLHGHLEDHGYRQQEGHPPDGAGGVIQFTVSGQCLLEQLPEVFDFCCCHYLNSL